MTARTKTMLTQWFSLLSMTILPILFCSMADSIKVALIFMGAYMLVYLVLHFLPVKCSTGLCTGRMHQKVKRISFWTERVQYECDTCGDIFEKEIFAPDITVEVSI